ncbi:MAG: radical SAM protein, partial [Candidatus Omnitrophota bacterium]
MNKIPPILQSAFHILNTYISSVILIYLCEESVWGTYTQLLAPGSYGIILIIPVFIFKLFIYSGIYGALVELSSGQEYCVTLDRFWLNMKTFWRSYLVLQVIKITLLFLIYMLAPKANLTLIGLWLDIPILFLMPLLIIRKKYTNPFELKRTPIRLAAAEGGLLLTLIAVQSAAFIIAKMFAGKSPGTFLGLMFLTKYLHLLLFILIAGIHLKSHPRIREHFKSQNEIFLVNPMGGGSVMTSLSFLSYRYHPSVFSVLKALTPPEYRIRVFSRVFWRNRYYRSNALVAITCHTCNSVEAYKIAKGFRKRGSKVVMGGPHAACFPQEALEFCDSVVVGEAESSWEEIIKDYESHSLKPVYHRQATEEQYQKVHQYLLAAPREEVKDYLETTHGCKFHCDFCSAQTLCEGKLRHKPVAEIVELIQKLRPWYKTFNFIDNNIYSDPSYAADLFRALTPLKIKWCASSSIDIAANDNILRLAKESGCAVLTIGYEIREASNEKNLGGKFALADQYVCYTKKFKKLGIKIRGNFMWGFDSDRFEHLWDYWKCCFSIFPFFTLMSLLTPLPGSKLYQNLLAQERLMSINWRSYTTFWLVFKPQHMTYQKLKIFFPFITAIFSLTTSPNGWLLINIFIVAAWK